jgi:hypothetical protein
MADNSFHIEIPREIAASELYSSGGFVIIPDLLGAGGLAELIAEAYSARPGAQRNTLAVSDGTEGRGGAPGRAFTSAHGGAVQWRLFNAPALLASLRRICGIGAVPTGGGTYTYYEQPGDFLALHRDIVTCDLAVITCLADTAEASAGGGLLVYPEHIRQPLTSARAAGMGAATPVPLGRGETVALLGGIVPHEVAPMQPGKERIVSVMCYHLAASSNPLS